VKKLPLPLTAKPSIAVLPSNDPSGDSYQEYLIQQERKRLAEARAKVEHELLEKEKKKLTLVPKTVSSTKVSLRTEPKLILDSYMQTTLKKYGFFDARLNPQGSFDNHFVDNGDGTVTDRSTGLMWQKSGSSTMRSRDKAQGYVSKLNETLFAKYWDWRLPTIDELASLLEGNQKNGLYIDPVFNEKQKRYWSSDIRDDSLYRKEIWIVDFATGRLTAGFIASQGTDASQFESNYVRAVRSTK